MIDLNRTRADLLAEIGVPTSPDATLSEVSDPRVITSDAVVRLRGHTRECLFPILEVVLSERMAAVPRPQVIRDLLMPLNHALGNAFKHGNGRDAGKVVSVELVLARSGVVVAVTDEGQGFDVGRTFRRFLARERYFENEGDGFRNLHRARSAIAFENGGRTVLLCFRSLTPEPEEDANLWPEFCVQRTDAEQIKGSLSPGLISLENGAASLGSGGLFAARARAGDECGIRAVLNVQAEAQPPWILTGRLHVTKSAAAADFQMAHTLYEAGTLKHVRAPRPVPNATSDPCLVFYDFHSWMNLWQYLAYWGSLKSLQHSSRRIGLALAELHNSQIAPGTVDTRRTEDQLVELAARAVRHLKTLPDGSSLARRFDLSVHGILRSAAPSRQRAPARIHGALGWDCIHYGVDKNFYFHRFEHCRWGDTRLDLGGFAADLLCFTLARRDEESYRTCCDEFLSHYNAKANCSMHTDELCFYIALAIVGRLQRADSGVQAARWLETLSVVCGRV